MQPPLSASKPLVFVVIGLVVGASLGLGSGYAVFYPTMVKQKNKSIDDQIMDLRNNMTLLHHQIEDVNKSITVIGDSLEEIVALTSIVEGISSRVSALENGQIILNNELNDLDGKLSSINDSFTALEDEWGNVANGFNDLETAYYAVNDELEDLQSMMRKRDGIALLTAYMANPPASFEQMMSNAIYEVLLVEEQNFENWVNLYGESTAKMLLWQEVDAIAGSLVWNPTVTTEVGDDSYQVKLGTFFTINFDPAKITVNNMHMEIRGIVDLSDGSISDLQVTLVEIT